MPIRNIRKIAETLAEQGAKSQDPDALSAVVRVALGRSIVQDVAGMRRELPVLTLDPDLERILNESDQEGGSPGLEPGLVDRLHESLSERAQKQEMAGEPAVLLVAPRLRPWLIAACEGHSQPARACLQRSARRQANSNDGSSELAGAG